jgi:hypothetical protein
MLSDFSIRTAQLRFPARFFGDDMKSSYLRAGAALACAVALTACGGDDGQLVLGGYISGITKTGLVLTNNGGSDFAVPVPTNGSGEGQFTFPDLIATDDRYNVEVKAMPSNVEKCDVYYGGGRAAYHITNVSVVCKLKTHGLSGSISNLNGNLILVNGSDRVELTTGAGSFALAEIAEDSPYTVAVLPQPAGQTCTVSNGTGIMGTAPVANVAVTCTP